ncbi:MAG: hypothetical protein A4E41_01299 [Methanoregulaceae archaeon PtaU1.Bin066]|nr:MAG: hypothetical protein A4E41_01299 [Methanoregulaceae archaeon PtaU1.Bin066]
MTSRVPMVFERVISTAASFMSPGQQTATRGMSPHRYDLVLPGGP